VQNLGQSGRESESAAVPAHGANPIALDSQWQVAQTRLDQFVDLNSFGDSTHLAVLERGELWNVLDDIIHRHNIDLIILGTHGKHGIKKLVLGSTAEQIFRRASCPVLTVGPHITSPVDAEGFKRIVFATDFSAGSMKALPFALSLAEENQAEMILLHVIPLVPLQHQESVAASARAELEELLPPDARDWCRPEFAIHFEFPAEGVLNLAESRQADLIVMGVPKGAAIASAHLPWAIAYEVVCHATCPVLTVRG
jgi:nucleotide-binding universal stress UspA family protein